MDSSQCYQSRTVPEMCVWIVALASLVQCQNNLTGDMPGRQQSEGEESGGSHKNAKNNTKYNLIHNQVD